MGYVPPKGVRPPQFEGKRTGRPKGSKTWSKAWRDCQWGYEHASQPEAEPPTPGAALWQAYASRYYWQVEEFLQNHDVV